MTPLYPEPLVFVDLETTGANATHDRITEIGIVQLDAGGARAWSSLVNPGIPIPSFIQSLTGINDEMVAGAPSFAELAEEVLLKLEGRVFVAHNARFDYGFLKNEFRRVGLSLRARVLCTVKLSRKLYPNEYKHNLDSLVARHGLKIEGERHRALTDAELLLQFLQAAHGDHPAEQIHAAIAELTRQPTLPAGLDPALLDEMPETPGVYLFYGDDDTPLYVGKSNNIRKRVLSHFASDHKAHKEMQLAQLVRRIDWRPSAGDFGALLLETRLVKELQPVYNTRLRATRELCAWVLEPGEEGLLQPRLAGLDELEVGDDAAYVFGPFRSKREANKLLDKLADGLNLCRQVLRLEPRAGKGSRACFGVQIGRCKGACIGKEAPGVHNARLLAALAKHRFASWPYPGPIGIPEGDAWAPQLHVIDSWRYLGAIHDPSELPELLLATRPGFDIDSYKLIQTELKRRGGQVKLL
ncbi:exonuclease domain-containing protein [Chitinolyticbacter meiyuanensis]|uniref:exonuclease domain-containing protein n=1 Tax=Chitinolyticbacter meiyuanensis TaxID=682798 RepID=UPI0011E5DB50|nr:exonuclease domain-containing protein [Chitinolyticbacter meiyuanensis]